MEKRALKAFGLKTLSLSLIFCMGSCASSKVNYQRGYASVWKEVVKSQAWKEALKNDRSESSTADANFYASTEDIAIVEVSNVNNAVSEPSFDEKYDFLVRRAYFKIIAEAQEADTRLEREYILRNAVALKSGKKKGKEFNQKLELVNKRYRAHRKMLEGLKSWNIFSEFGTNDLDFFKAENKVAVQKMLQNGKREEAVINFLIYKLADLYHYES